MMERVKARAKAAAPKAINAIEAKTGIDIDRDGDVGIEESYHDEESVPESEPEDEAVEEALKNGAQIELNETKFLSVESEDTKTDNAAEAIKMESLARRLLL